MAVTIPARAGSALRFGIRYWNPTKTELLDTEGYTARIQFRSTNRPARVLLSQNEYAGAEPVPAGTVLTRVTPGEWRVYLSRAMTRSLPSTTRFEVELASNSDPDDVENLFEGVINTTPEGVTNA